MGGGTSRRIGMGKDSAPRGGRGNGLAGFGFGGFGLMNLGVTSQRLASQNSPVELMDHPSYVSARLMIRGNAVVLINGGWTGVVSGEGQRKVVVVAGEQRIKVGGTAADVFVGAEAVSDAKFGGGAGHELHEAASACSAHRTGVAVALGFDQAGEEVDVEIVGVARGGQHLVQVGGREIGAYGRGLGRSRAGLSGGVGERLGRRVGEMFNGGNLF